MESMLAISLDVLNVGLKLQLFLKFHRVLIPGLHRFFLLYDHQVLILFLALTLILLWVTRRRSSFHFIFFTLFLDFVNKNVAVNCLRLLRVVVVIHIYHVIVARHPILVIIEVMNLEGYVFFELLYLAIVNCNFRHLVSKTVLTLSYGEFSFMWGIESVSVTLKSVELWAIDRYMSKFVTYIAFNTYLGEITACSDCVLDF